MLKVIMMACRRRLLPADLDLEDILALALALALILPIVTVLLLVLVTTMAGFLVCLFVSVWCLFCAGALILCAKYILVLGVLCSR